MCVAALYISDYYRCRTLLISCHEWEETLLENFHEHLKIFTETDRQETDRQRDRLNNTLTCMGVLSEANSVKPTISEK